ncbi:E3 ubiquitin-protein ligase RING1 [Cloeon dipterum]|uniref:E3 ubiquitin-protein ligase RING1 n=1 Tax=Cloeon dipterum TaxID=197152 RepID=UPI00321F6417
MSASDAAGLTKTWELSLYELHRTQQNPVTDNSEIAVSPRSLHSELMCPICLDMLKKTMTTKECLHRFCSDCIITALRSGNKECPTCRKKLVSKRSLRPDPNFDSLIQKIYPSRDEYEAHQERVMAKLNKSHSQAALMNSISEGIKLQNQNRPQRRPKGTEADTTPTGTAPSTPNPQPEAQGSSSHAPSPVPASSSGQQLQQTQPPPQQQQQPPQQQNKPKKMKVLSSDDSGSDMGHESTGEGENSSDQSSNEIELVFKPHPTEMPNNAAVKALKENSIRFLKTTANATVDHLSKYLAMRIAIDLHSGPKESLINFCIYISPTAGHYVVLNGNQTLSHVIDRFWKVKDPLEMFYSWKES